MAAITNCSDFGDQKNSDTVSVVSPSISHEVMVLPTVKILHFVTTNELVLIHDYQSLYFIYFFRLLLMHFSSSKILSRGSCYI